MPTSVGGASQDKAPAPTSAGKLRMPRRILFGSSEQRLGHIRDLRLVRRGEESGLPQRCEVPPRRRAGDGCPCASAPCKGSDLERHWQMQEAVLSPRSVALRANRCNKRAGAAMSYKKCVKNRPDTLVCATPGAVLDAKTSFPSMSLH